MKNSYGIFVIHKALVVAEGHLKENLIKKLYESIQFLTNKKLKEKWLKIVDDSQNGISEDMAFLGSPKNES